MVPSKYSKQGLAQVLQAVVNAVNNGQAGPAGAVQAAPGVAWGSQVGRAPPIGAFGPTGQQGQQGHPGLTGARGVYSPGVGANPNVGQPAQANVKKPSDQRFRSFAERYVIARAHLFRVPPSEHMVDQWECVLDARRMYAMIERTGRNIEPEEGIF